MGYKISPMRAEDEKEQKFSPGKYFWLYGIHISSYHSPPPSSYTHIHIPCSCPWSSDQLHCSRGDVLVLRPQLPRPSSPEIPLVEETHHTPTAGKALNNTIATLYMLGNLWRNIAKRFICWSDW